jgi:enediyne polyketide synthase
VAEEARPARTAPALAVIGLACRFPDADDAPDLLDVVLTGRRSFRRIPPVRLDLADYYQPDPATSDATYSTRVAVLEGWQFDCEGLGITPAAYAAADPALWLALETTARALAGAGLTGGNGLNRDRTGVIIGNTLGGDTSRANALRVRWPYVRRILSDALTSEVSASQAGAVLRRAERQYLAPFPAIGPDTLAGSSPAAIATGICRYFGFRGAGLAVDGGGSSSLQAIASACSALTAGELDVAIAGGVDISLDPLELIGMAKAGVLASGDVRIYDEHPTGYLPAEGCGVVVLMRTADARAAGLPVYAEIAGWGTSVSGSPAAAEPPVSSQLLAMQRAYERAGIDPADIQLFEGNGAGIGPDDEAELAALGALRSGARQPAVLGSVKANIGHAKAAAGAAALIKTVLSVSAGVLPPATGVTRPHALVRGGEGRLTLPQVAQEWPDGIRLAGVSTLNSGGSNVHLVLRGEATSRPRHDRWRLRGMPVRSLDDNSVVPRLLPAVTEPVPFLLHDQDRFALASVLSRLASIARWLSDAELHDLACLLGREPGQQGRTRVALVAAGQEQLATLAAEAATLLADLDEGRMSVRPGIFASDNADGQVMLLLSGEQPGPAGDALRAGGLTESVDRCIDALRWFESLDVHSRGAVAHGLGALAGLAWAGVLGQGDVTEIAKLRAEFLATGSAQQAAPSADAAGPGQADAARRRPDPDALHAAVAQKFRFGPPRRLLISTATGTRLESVADVIDLICRGFSGAAGLADAITAGASGATLLLETGPGRELAAAAARSTSVPAVSLDAGPADPAASGLAAAALFAAGALGQPQALFAGRSSRPIDIWRERTFITSPCEARPDDSVTAEPAPAAAPARADAGHGAAATGTRDRRSQELAAQGGGPGSAGSSKAAAPADPDSSRKFTAGHGQLSELRDEFERRLPDRSSAPVTSTSLPGQHRMAGSRHDPDRMTGLAPWARCFAEALRPARSDGQPPGRASAQSDRPSQRNPRRTAKLAWRLHVAGDSDVRAAAGRIFGADKAAARTLAVVGDPADGASRAAALRAARDAITTGQLVVLTTSAGFTGFFAGLQAEHPTVGITVLRIPGGADNLSLAVQFAHAEPGVFRELVLTEDGVALEPRMAETTLPGGGTFPLGPDDVVLVSRGARGAGLALAHVLACCGTPVAVIGRPGTDDSELVAGLEQLRSAGARVGYEVIDIDDPASLAAAVDRIEARLGPVTAIGHAVSPGDLVPFLDRTDVDISEHVTSETATLDHLVSSVKAGQLRLIVTFGSVAGRYGLAGGSMLALGTGAVAGRAVQLARAAGNCRSLHVDLPAWSTAGLGDSPELAGDLAAAGTAAIEVTVAARLLLKIMTTPGLPDRLALHGRVSGPAAHPSTVLAAADLAAAGLPKGGRFLRDVQVYYPGTELICEPSLALATDPYLADYLADGMPVLPSVLCLEALAQAASVLAGRPLRSASNVRLESPIVIPAGSTAQLRICAQREGSVIVAALRCGDSSFAVDHAWAEFSCAGEADDLPGQLLAAAPSALSGLTAGTSGLVDGAELYGPIAFQSGRFRRVALLPEVTARSCRALARGADDQPWFSPDSPLAGTAFLLGSPGLNDAVLQTLQASMPHRRVRPAGCACVQFSGTAAVGPVEIRAVAEPLRAASPRGVGKVPLPRHAKVPGQAAAPDAEMHQPSTAGQSMSAEGPRAQLWDVEAVDAAGNVLATWRGVRLRDCGSLPRNAAWPPTLLSVFLERRAADFGLDDGLRITVSCGQPDLSLPQLAAVIPPQAAPADGEPPAAGRPVGRQPASRPAQHTMHAAGTGALAGFGLTVRAAGPLACSWVAAEPGHRQQQPAAGLVATYARLRAELTESPTVLAARLEAVLASCSLAGIHDIGRLTVTRTASDGWALFETGRVRIACAVVEISGVPAPVAIALLTGKSGTASQHEVSVSAPLALPARTAAQLTGRARGPHD